MWNYVINQPLSLSWNKSQLPVWCTGSKLDQVPDTDQVNYNAHEDEKQFNQVICIAVSIVSTWTSSEQNKGAKSK